MISKNEQIFAFKINNIRSCEDGDYTIKHFQKISFLIEIPIFFKIIKKVGRTTDISHREKYINSWIQESKESREKRTD